MRSLIAFLFLGILALAPSCDSPTDPNNPDGKGDATLAELSLSGTTLSPAFSGMVTAYTAPVSSFLDAVQVMARPTDAAATIKINGTAATAGTATAIGLAMPMTMITIDVTAPQGAMKSYVVTAMKPQSPVDYIKASNSGASDRFGYAIAMSGDTLAVGAYLEASNATTVGGNQNDNSASGAGAVYIFKRSGNSWMQEAYIKASNAAMNDLFGYSVALDGDTLAVGAPGEDSNATGVGGAQGNDLAVDSGAVYVFMRSGTTWAQQAYVKSSNPNTGDQFGISLALSGETMAVGAFHEQSNATGVNGTQSDNSTNNAGAVYVFLRSGTTWAQQAYIKASNTDADDSFGYRLALLGDTLAVSAVGESSSAKGIGGNQSDDSAMSAGAVYVFLRSGTTWAQQAYIKASNTAANQYFGSGVALTTDGLAVGSFRESSNATFINGNQNDTSVMGSGAVYLFRRSGTTWAQQAYVKSSNTGPDDAFGVSVALSGDSLAVGAHNEAGAGMGVNTGDQQDNSANQAGAVYFIH